MLGFLVSKPVLIGLHLGLAIAGIDALLWLLGKFKDRSGSTKSRTYTASAALLAFIASWIFGGYYYVKYYGALVKPVIIKGLAPWAHNIIMEAKEHIFLFLIPMTATIFFLSLLDNEELDRSGLRSVTIWLVGITAGLGLLIGLMGFIISAAARWGV